MELWIRSQQNDAVGITPRLIKAKSIALDYEGENDTYYILVNNIEVGYYHSEKRALEVLDEIQRLIEDLQYMSYAIPNKEFTGYRPNVYEMPEK